MKCLCLDKVKVYIYPWENERNKNYIINAKLLQASGVISATRKKRSHFQSWMPLHKSSSLCLIFYCLELNDWHWLCHRSCQTDRSSLAFIWQCDWLPSCFVCDVHFLNTLSASIALWHCFTLKQETDTLQHVVCCQNGSYAPIMWQTVVLKTEKLGM